MGEMIYEPRKVMKEAICHDMLEHRSFDIGVGELNITKRKQIYMLEWIAILA